MTCRADELERLRSAFCHCPDAGPAEDLPEAGRIWAAVRGEAGHEEVATLVDLALAHPEVAQEWRLAREMGEASREVRVVSMWRRRFAPVLAAAAVIVVALVPLLWRQTTGSDPVYRGGDQRVLQSEVVEEQSLPGRDLILRWTDIGDDVVYSVVVTTADLEVLARAEGLVQPELRVSGEALAPVGEGGHYLWRVEAVSGDGRTVASKTFVQGVR